MHKFESLSSAAEKALTLASEWQFANSDEMFNAERLLVTAQMSDQEDPIDEDSLYVVSAAGSIGLCPDGDEIDWLFLNPHEAITALPDNFSL